jgi:hypothetical protein
MEHQRFEALHLGKSGGDASTLIYIGTTGPLSREICLRPDRNLVPK